MFNWLGGSKGMKPNRKYQPRCSNFERLEATIREARHKHKKSTEFLKLHSSYEELENCARLGCVGCRVVRQGLILSQITIRQVGQLESRDAPVYVRLWTNQETTAKSTTISLLQAVLGTPLHQSSSVDIALTTNVDRPMLPERRYDLVIPQIRSWLDDCCTNHKAQCGNLSWSKENPGRLIEIVSDSKVKLIDASSLPKLEYVALSYCWGTGGSQGNTTSHNLLTRQAGFLSQDLTDTIRDAIILVRRLGLAYLWVDQVCIVQPADDADDADDADEANGEDWDLEGSRMHIVYGNAVFTLNACSSEASTDGLFRPRKAWTYPVKPFYLENEWLVNFDMTLKEVRLRAPLSSRGWVLQEERLSPRLLYLCGQRFYWSCAGEQHMELASDPQLQSASLEKPFLHKRDQEKMSKPQAFLDVRFDGDKLKLHKEWQDLVESYCLRNLTQASDRFRAISGLAAQYLRVYLNKDNRFSGQEYLAGLWRASFAEDLAWSVSRAGDPRRALTDLAPTWSWASLPLCTRINTKEPFSPVSDFNLVTEADLSDHTQDSISDPGAIVLQACRKGAEKKSIAVRGRLQRIMNDNFQSVDWSDIEVNQSTSSEYSFAKYIDQQIYAREPNTGKIVIHEPTKRAMEGQLDYLISADGRSIQSGSIHVPVGAERDLFGLRIGAKTMLLLQLKCSSDQGELQTLTASARHEPSAYHRVGICRNVRDAFFDGVDISELELG
ncbi:hypothetical protein H2200_000887 [Cladophialophora chaetospira]|uniref:Heterokaryon incompatibility domain-containing protein n=1 Tax=Cladophialophora chaetospira TaxID=386627 RepID=A0AA38XQ67_9EURO|nr:hypothetical protein H2200_000887 [Cladophialophora chaetospira]